ncbi:major Facilitator Superfamily protein [Francisella philomiragia subsp. philomiragia ATCC 25015]|uniref:MFS transporter n=1 Tax=Francisella philomiragia TaxID=28110 RepID=UPI0001AF7DB4|nr:MFS transporter [Francisella philomiragia]AJI75292.1 major Facilitator Superfamily protein [Francisella philomiragia subsp. philomiragia ATCC 25015]EET21774.1 major facilitator superfamily transporter [Francisella philomiragia subsp. philomiragia ATCC 25015]MBK2238945.1 MFS transporter [Francisella philomiragia]QUE32001.1 MFS transporter [Francisella philomiragia]
MDKNKIIAYTIGIVFLIELIDGSALNTALPQIANDFQVNALALKVAVTVYLLALGLFIPASGWISDKIGCKKLLIISLIGFIISSVACGLSTNIISLVIFRAFQGAFGAFTAPVARLAMVRIFKNDRLTAMSIVAVIATLGPVIGPLVGGAMTTYIGWRMIFFINFPIVLICIILISIYLPNISVAKIRKFDFKGFLILGISIALLMFFIDLMIDASILPNIKWLILLSSIILFVVYLRHAIRLGDNAVINLNIFKNNCFKYLTIISSTTRLLIMGMSFLLPLYLQTKQHFSAFESGLALMFFIMPAWYVKKIVKKVLISLHFYKFFVITLTIMAFTYLSLGIVFIDFNFFAFSVLLIIIGICFGMFTIVCNAGIYNSIENDEHMSPATIVNSSIIQLTNAFAISWASVVLAMLSGVKDISFDSIISSSAFAWVQVIYFLGLLAILAYVILCKPNNLNKVSTS